CLRERARRGCAPAFADTRLADRGSVRDWRRARATGRRYRASWSLRLSDLGVYAQQARNRLRWPPPESAFGGDAEIACVFLRDGDASPRSFDTVGIVHESKEELGPRMELQVEQRREVGVIDPISRYRHVQIIE